MKFLIPDSCWFWSYRMLWRCPGNFLFLLCSCHVRFNLHIFVLNKSRNIFLENNEEKFDEFSIGSIAINRLHGRKFNPFANFIAIFIEGTVSLGAYGSVFRVACFRWSSFFIRFFSIAANRIGCERLATITSTITAWELACWIWTPLVTRLSSCKVFIFFWMSLWELNRLVSILVHDVCNIFNEFEVWHQAICGHFLIE